MSVIKELDKTFESFKEKLNELEHIDSILKLKAEYLGKKGQISSILKSLRDATKEERKIIGPKANEIKEKILFKINDSLMVIEIKKINEKLKNLKIDTSLVDKVLIGKDLPSGPHPRTPIVNKIEDIFISMGFEVLDGPHVEDEFHNFEALNIPKSHPARDMQDTFWFHDPNNEDTHDDNKKYLLRTHTSPIQIRGMLERKPPFRFIAPGTVFRCERTDASHEIVFNQLEGMMIGKNISVSNLIYFMKTLLKEILEKDDINIRLRPGFFPFVEPGFELDIECVLCKGNGCSVCKKTGWVELLPCGMVHPNVLTHGGIDPNKWSGFAFGLGLDRLVMMKWGIDNITHLNSGDLRFNNQFATFS